MKDHGAAGVARTALRGGEVVPRCGRRSRTQQTSSCMGKGVVARAAVPEGFVADAVLLAVEGESDERGCQDDVGVGACGMVLGPGANPEASSDNSSHRRLASSAITFTGPGR